MTEKSWLSLLIILTIISILFSVSIWFTGNYNSYVLRMISGYEPPTSQIKLLRKQFSLARLEVPADKLKELQKIVSNRYHIVPINTNPKDVGVSNPFVGK